MQSGTASPMAPQQQVHPDYLLSLTSIVLKNLKHQADWSETTIHTSLDLPRPLISGVPPGQIYLDPDTLAANLVKDEMAGNEEGGEDDGLHGRKVEREWVLPVDLREKWTVRQWAEVFDSIPAEPPAPSGSGENDHEGSDGRVMGESKRKKRIVMAIVSGDSTVVYYIVHDGIVKPRQN